MKRLFEAVKHRAERVKPKLQRRFDRFPLRLNFFLLLLFFFVGYYYIKGQQLAVGSYASNEQMVETSSFLAVITVLLKLLLVFSLALLLFSFISSFLPYALFAHRVRAQKGFFSIDFSAQADGDSTKTTAHVHVERLTIPLLGSAKLRFYYDEGFRTSNYSFPSRALSFMFADKADFTCQLYLHDVRSYVADSVVVRFGDMLHLFSFSKRYRLNSLVYTLPQKKEIDTIPPIPTHAKETNLRTEVVRRVEGELLRFKDFEASDDIRRIVWKVYAKNKELVVRVPELRNPFASEVSFFASYYNSFLSTLTNKQESAAFLNYYKHLVWSLYTGISENKDISLRLLSDQELNVKFLSDISEVQQRVSASCWQNEVPLSTVFQSSDVSLLCLTSLVDVSEVEKIKNKLSSSTVVVLCCFSELFDAKNPKNYLRMLFVKPKEGSVDKPLWRVSPLRARLSKNEKQLVELLKQTDATVNVVSKIID